MKINLNDVEIKDKFWQNFAYYFQRKFAQASKLIEINEDLPMVAFVLIFFSPLAMFAWMFHAFRYARQITPKPEYNKGDCYGGGGWTPW